MPKKNKSKQKKRAKRQTPRGRSVAKARKRMPGLSHGPVAQLVRSVLRPDIVSGCVPDGVLGSGCFTLKEVGTVSTGAAGSVGGIIVLPAPQQLYYNITGSTGSTLTVTGNWTGSSQLSSTTTFYRTFRPISACIKVEFIGNTQTDAGLLYLCQFPGDASYSINNLNGLTLAAAATASMMYKRYPLRNGCYVTWRPGSMDDMQNWNLTTNSVPAVTGATLFPFMAVFMDGANASSACFAWELVVNFEGQFANNGWQPGGQKQAVAAVTPEPGWYEKMRTMVDKVESMTPLVKSLTDAGTTFKSIYDAYQAGVPRLGFYPDVD